jgi:hypothetical protein
MENSSSLHCLQVECETTYCKRNEEEGAKFVVCRLISVLPTPLQSVETTTLGPPSHSLSLSTSYIACRYMNIVHARLWSLGRGRVR